MDSAPSRASQEANTSHSHQDMSSVARTPPRRCDGSIDLPNRRDGSLGFRPNGAPVRAGSNKSTRFGADFEGRKPAPSHETLCLFLRRPHSAPCFTVCSEQLPTAPRQQQGFRQNEASAETGAPFSRAPGASEKPLNVPKLARTSEGFLP